MRVKTILLTTIGVLSFLTTFAASSEITTLCRFLNPETGIAEIGVVLKDDRILPLQTAYSQINNGEISPKISSIPNIFANGYTKGKTLLNNLVQKAKSKNIPYLIPENVTLLTPVDPIKLVAGSIFEGHATKARESWARELMPVGWAIAKMIGGGPFSPPDEHYEKVTYYQGNHLDWYPHGSSIKLPKGWESLDFEIEIAMLMIEDNGKIKVGGYFLFNDVTSRKTQGLEIDKIKHGFSSSKHINAAGWKFVLADSVDFSKLTPSATVKRSNGETEKLCHGSTIDALFTPEEIIESILEQDGKIRAGQVILTGAMTGCCGLEIMGAADADLLYPGDTIIFESNILGNLENSVIK